MGDAHQMSMDISAIAWRRLDAPGFESARLLTDPTGWKLEGSAVFVSDGDPCRLDYEIFCRENWETRAALVSGWVGEQVIRAEIAVDNGRRWQLNGQDVPAVAGCLDLDLNFSPVTNLLPVRRLNLAVGEEQPVRAAWLRFPDFSLEVLEQTYHRLDELHYRYQSQDGAFIRELEVHPRGWIMNYPGYWEMAAVTG